MPENISNILKGLSIFLVGIFASLAIFRINFPIINNFPASLRVLLSIAFFIYGTSKIVQPFQKVI